MRNKFAFRVDHQIRILTRGNRQSRVRARVRRRRLGIYHHSRNRLHPKCHHHGKCYSGTHFGQMRLTVDSSRWWRSKWSKIPEIAAAKRRTNINSKSIVQSRYRSSARLTEKNYRHKSNRGTRCVYVQKVGKTNTPMANIGACGASSSSVQRHLCLGHLLHSPARGFPV